MEPVAVEGRLYHAVTCIPRPSPWGEVLPAFLVLRFTKVLCAFASDEAKWLLCLRGS